MTFSVEKGEYVAIMGESRQRQNHAAQHSGRAGQAYPRRGAPERKAAFLHALKRRCAAFRRDNLGFVFQDFNLLDTFSIRDNIFLPLVLAGCPCREMENRLGPIAQQLGIGGILSISSPTKSAAARSSAPPSPAPSSPGPSSFWRTSPPARWTAVPQTSLLRLFGEINEDGQTILMVTHSVKAASHAGRVMFIKDGEVFHQLYRGLDGTEGLYQRISDTLTVIATGGARHA